MDLPSLPATPTGREYLTTSSDTIEISKGLESMDLSSSDHSEEKSPAKDLMNGTEHHPRQPHGARHRWLSANSRALCKSNDGQSIVSKSERVVALPHRLLAHVRNCPRDRLRRHYGDAEHIQARSGGRRDSAKNSKCRSCLGKSGRGRQRHVGLEARYVSLHVAVYSVVQRHQGVHDSSGRMTRPWVHCHRRRRIHRCGGRGGEGGR